MHPKRRTRKPAGTEQPAEFYDEAYRVRENYHLHYTKSVYYFLWCVIIDRLRGTNASKILDLGCGPGQFAKFVQDSLGIDYCGVDFSARAIGMARQLCPEYEFLIEDLKSTACLAALDYDCVVSLEFLEHISTDLNVLRALRGGVRAIMSVPNYDSRGHVRFFRSADEVRDRYGGYFLDLDVQFWLLAERGHGFYLLDGELR